jgi:hypothetical protein
VLEAFLQAAGLQPLAADDHRERSVAEIADSAKKATVQVICMSSG